MSDDPKPDEDEKKENLIPQSRFNEATGKLKDQIATQNERLANLEGQLASSKKTDEPTEYTRAELRSFVDSEQITQAQADDFWDKQVDRKHKAHTDNTVKEALSGVKDDNQATHQANVLVADIQKYVDVVPDLTDEDSDERAKIEKEYNRISKRMGQPKKDSVADFEMQVLALENIYGSVAQLKSRLDSKADRQTMQDVGDSKPEAPSSGPIKNLNPRQKAFYEKGIDQGRYADWKEVEEELSYVRRKDRTGS